MKILHTTEQVQQRIDEMAQEIIERFSEQKPLFVCLLKGAVPFTAQLMAAIARHEPAFHPEVVYMQTSAYGVRREAGEAVIFSTIAADEISGREIIILDDCLDKGVTYTETKRHLLEQGVASVGLVVLANKNVPRDGVDEPLLSGFNTPNVWLTGMGMDDAEDAPEAQRWAGYIGDVSA